MKDEFKDERFWKHIDPDKLYTPKEAAALLACHINTVYNKIYLGEIKQFRAGGYKIPGWSLVEYIQANCTEE